MVQKPRLLIPRLDPRDPAFVVDVPDGDRIGGIVDPTFAVDAVGLRQDVFGELLGLRIEAEVAAGVQLAAAPQMRQGSRRQAAARAPTTPAPTRAMIAAA